MTEPLRHLLTRLVSGIDRGTAWSGRWLAWLPLAMALATAGVVILRYALNQGSIALQEAVMYAHAALILLGISYTLQQDAHVRVDLLYTRLSERQRQMVNTIGHVLFLLPLCVTVLIVTWPYAAASWQVREGSPEVGGLPGVFILKSLLPMMALWLLLQTLAELLRPLTDRQTQDRA